MCDLIDYYRQNRVPVTGRSGSLLINAVHRADWMLQNEEVLVINKIGKGNFGDVFKGSLMCFSFINFFDNRYSEVFTFPPLLRVLIFTTEKAICPRTV